MKNWLGSPESSLLWEKSQIDILRSLNNTLDLEGEWQRRDTQLKHQTLDCLLAHPSSLFSIIQILSSVG